MNSMNSILKVESVVQCLTLQYRCSNYEKWMEMIFIRQYFA